MEKEFDILIVGGGVTGTALLYTLTRYSSVKSIGLVEKYDKIAQVQSASSNNSQTLHMGDIESHYTPEKAKKTKKAANYVRNYVEQHTGLHRNFQKMLLAVGDEEVKTLRKREKEFSKIFPYMRLVEHDELVQIEPRLVEGRDPNEKILATYTKHGYAVNYGKLAQSFVKEVESDERNDIILGEKIIRIKKDKNGFVVECENCTIKAKTVVVAASAFSLHFAQEMGLGKDLVLLPVAGNFFTANKLLNGKVYAMQNPKLPFAAVHGDPDVQNPNVTRFGPIALVVPMLERRRLNSVADFFRLLKVNYRSITALLSITLQPLYFQYVFWNVLYSIPGIGSYLFSKEIRKLIPSIRGSQLKYGKDIGGVRPQIINVKTKKVALGEAKLKGNKIIFNITPSPGASVCLSNAKDDALTVCSWLGEKFDEKAFERDLGKD